MAARYPLSAWFMVWLSVRIRSAGHRVHWSLDKTRHINQRDGLLPAGLGFDRSGPRTDTGAVEPGSAECAMNKSYWISALLFLIFLGLVHSQSGNDPYIVGFKTVDIPNLDIKSNNILEQLNRANLDGISPEDNIISGLYELAPVRELQNADPERIAAIEKALGIKVSKAQDADIYSDWDYVWAHDPKTLSLTHDYRRIKRYLDRHERTLDKFQEIAQRSYWVEPYYSENQSLLVTHLPAGESVQMYTRALTLRARIALRDNQIQEAIAASTAMYSAGKIGRASGRERV